MRSAAEWARIRMTGTCVGNEDIRLRNLPYEDFITEVQQEAKQALWEEIAATTSKAFNHDAKATSATYALICSRILDQVKPR